MLNAAPAHPNQLSTAPTARVVGDNGYGRARLWLGITGVGLWVVVSVSLLAMNAIPACAAFLPAGPIGDASLVGLLLLSYVLLQLPLDCLGGYVVPRQFNRRVKPANTFAKILVRGITVHAMLLLISASVLYTGGRVAGLPGAWGAGVLWMVGLAVLRGPIAGLMAKLRTLANVDQKEGTKLVVGSDEGFTGGITGLLSPKTNILSAEWKTALHDDQFKLAKARREAVMRDGTWRKGQIGALTFTSTGLFVALLLAGPSTAGTGVGVVETGLWFTLWAFAGLLTLPTLSRAAIYRTDHTLIEAGIGLSDFQNVTNKLDQRQDGEPKRSPWVERVFHPIPSTSNRTCANGKAGGLWNIARTSVYLGLSSLSLLTRSVHCNVGRPELWVWLPTE